MIDKTIDQWDRLHELAAFKLKYPSELVVQYVFRNFPDRAGIKMLDIGAGAGRHSVFMAEAGFTVSACDVSPNAAKNIREIGENRGLHIEASVCPAYELPFPDESFDGCISYAVYYYMTWEYIEQAFHELYRVLKPGGKAIIFVRTVDDHRFGAGKEIEPNTFVIQEYDQVKSSFYENDMVMHFFTREELLQLAKPFSEIALDRIDETIHNNKYVESNYILKVTK